MIYSVRYVALCITERGDTMSENSEHLETIVDASVEVDGRKTMPCVKAFELADQLGVKLSEIGAICNDSKIKIVSCQLGCFQ